MLVYFKNREAMRKAKFGSAVDNGKDAPKGKRFARKLTAVKTKQ